ncbi:MAG: archaeosortase/exosortase family protein [Burkholderiales bacterium]|nr:archaeosortase/exosortase family protein [Burkholderiales bacterium]
MSAILPQAKQQAADRTGWLAWTPVLLGLAVLYLPTYWDLAHGLWQTEENGHGPIILAVTIWLLYQKRAALLAESERSAPGRGLGAPRPRSAALRPRTLAGHRDVRGGIADPGADRRTAAAPRPGNP